LNGDKNPCAKSLLLECRRLFEKEIVLIKVFYEDEVAATRLLLTYQALADPHNPEFAGHGQNQHCEYKKRQERLPRKPYHFSFLTG
jgi:hypothetical protein